MQDLEAAVTALGCFVVREGWAGLERLLELIRAGLCLQPGSRAVYISSMFTEN